ncbi:hypothetical protein GDO86_003155 [Hymenochirus boettgeri]|uniref:Protein-lysine N-methyltransferase SMYD4 n=1 Tax=Hymenochirus boettgeri TaxID=247094 RepID=A0A8T2K080_9PIPI|nr:hypothetical protein GDO86_003155 [Hymenochirus boettgeri]
MEHPMQEWQEHVRMKWEHLTLCEKHKFSSTANIDEIFSFCWRQLQQKEEVFIQRICCNRIVAKEPDAVLFYKNEGNRRFAEKQFETSSILYSKGISHASPGSVEMAICFANRSAALFHRGEYSVCLEDIKRAEEHGYPVHLRDKILRRQSECLLKLLKPLTTSNSTTPKSPCAEIVQLNIEANKNMSDDRTQELGLKGNPQISNASSSLCLQFNNCKGRHLLASQSIEQGEVLILEEAYASVIIPERKHLFQGGKWTTKITNCDLYCHCCLKKVKASLPCPSCSFAIYCSQDCMDKAWRSYHNIECSLGDLLIVLGVFCQTALRAVLIAGCSLFTQVVQQYSTADAKSGTPCYNGMGTQSEKYCSSYKAVVSLLTHTENNKEEQKFMYGLTAAALCKKLYSLITKDAVSSSLEIEKSIPSESSTAENWSSVLPLIGPAILRHMLQLYCNAQAVTVIEEDHDESKLSLVKNSKKSRLATAIFPVLSMLNHSCDPNTTVSFNGRCTIVRANRSIKKDEEVTHCYGPHKLRMKVEERQKLLNDQYFFMCQCEACTKENRLKETMSNEFCCPVCRSHLEGKEELHCTICTYSVARFQVMSRFQQLEKNFQMGKGHLQENKADEAKKVLMMCLLEAKSFLCQNHLLLGEIFDHLAQAEASYGNWMDAAGHLRKSINVVEFLYGPSSLELGHELFKLSQILFNGFEVTDALSTALQAQKILSVHYGSDHNLVQELKEMEECILQLPGFKG